MRVLLPSSTEPAVVKRKMSRRSVDMGERFREGGVIPFLFLYGCE